MVSYKCSHPLLISNKLLLRTYIFPLAHFCGSVIFTYTFCWLLENNLIIIWRLWREIINNLLIQMLEILILFNGMNILHITYVSFLNYFFIYFIFYYFFPYLPYPEFAYTLLCFHISLYLSSWVQLILFYSVNIEIARC